MPNIRVVATMVAKPGCLEKLRAAATALLAPSRKDPGCLGYDLHQSVEDSATFVFIETWESRELLEAHLRTPHLEAFLPLAGELTEHMDIKLLESIAAAE